MPRELYGFLAEKQPDLAAELDEICKASANIWASQRLEQFTVHGEPHIREVERNLDSLTASLRIPGTPNCLTAQEIFVLIAACHLHDIGMQLGVPDAREKHAEYSYQLILGNKVTSPDGQPLSVELPIKDNAACEAIAKVARAHWTDFALKLDEDDYIYGNNRGRVKLLGVLLATADLLDVSAIRASYYLGRHRLFELEPLSKLHQTMHALVRGSRIRPEDPQVPEKLVFELEWRDESSVVRDLTLWQLRWFCSQQRQLMPELERLSGGRVRWAAPWAQIKFHSPVGQNPNLPDAARRLLDLELAKQTLIDRDQVVEELQDALGRVLSSMYFLHSSSDSDARQVVQWFESWARNEDSCIFARVDAAPTETAYNISDLIAQLFVQWGKAPPTWDDSEAMRRLKDYVHSEPEKKFALVAEVDQYRENTLDPIVETIVSRDQKSMERGGHIFLLVCPHSQRPGAIKGVRFHELTLTSFTLEVVEVHLESRYGYDESDRKEIAQRIGALDLLDAPARVYTYIESHCDNEAWQESGQVSRTKALD